MMHVSKASGGRRLHFRLGLGVQDHKASTIEGDTSKLSHTDELNRLDSQPSC